MNDSFAGYERLGPPQSEGGLERFWARRPGLPARITRATALVPSEVAEALAEAWAISTRFDHPGVLRTLDTGRDADRPWIAQEVIDAITLEQLLTALRQTGHVLPADVLLELAMRVSEALAHVHAAAGPDGRQLMLTHGGVCPANVWLTRDGKVKLDGFRTPSDPRPPVADPAYLAPELSIGAAPDPRTDLYALGVLLAEMIAGTRPDVEQPDTLASRLSARADLPEALPGLVAELLAKDRDARPQLARMLTHRLDNLTGLVKEPAGFARYVAGGVEHLKPANPDDVPARLLAEVRAAGTPYPPGTAPALVQTPLAPSGDDELSAAPGLKLPVPGQNAPALKLPAPAQSAPNLNLPTPAEAPAPLLAFDDKPPGKANDGKWKPKADGGGLPTWLMVAMAVLSVVGAFAIARLFFVEDADERRERRRANGPVKRLAKPPPGAPRLLEVTSDPPGAIVFLDGQRTDAETPATFGDVRPGAKVRVFVMKAGFKDTSPQTVEIDPRRTETRSAHFVLKRLLRYRIETTPPGATVRVEGRQSPQTTPFWLEVSARERVDLTIEKRGYLPSGADFIASTTTPTITHVKLEAARLFDISSTPSGATVTIDGEPVGKTPLTEHPVRRGRRFELEVSRPDTKPYKRSLTARGSLVHTVKVKLRELPLAKLPLTPGERTELGHISDVLKEARTALRVAQRQVKAAQRAVRRFENAATIDVSELEVAQEQLDEAETQVSAKKAEYETKKSALKDLREQVVERLALP